jgi:general secretion pathway protein N
MLTTLLVLATIASAAAATMAMIGQTDVKSDPASANFVKENQPKIPNPAHRMATGNPLWAIPMKALAATQDRPLFSPTRRPPAPPVTALPAPPQPPIEPERPPLVLIGTVVGENEAIAVFLDQSTHRTVSLLSGQGQHGWLLGKVHKKDVVLRKNNAIVMLTLSAGATAPVVIAAQEPEPRLVRRQR